MLRGEALVDLMLVVVWVFGFVDLNKLVGIPAVRLELDCFYGVVDYLGIDTAFDKLLRLHGLTVNCYCYNETGVKG